MGFTLVQGFKGRGKSVASQRFGSSEKLLKLLFDIRLCYHVTMQSIMDVHSHLLCWSSQCVSRWCIVLRKKCNQMLLLFAFRFYNIIPYNPVSFWNCFCVRPSDHQWVLQSAVLLGNSMQKHGVKSLPAASLAPRSHNNTWNTRTVATNCC